MAQPSYPYPPPPQQPAPPPSMAPVVGPQFCAPYPVDLTITEKLNFLQGKLAITDLNGNLIFTVKRSHFSMRDRFILVDASGNPVISVQQKIISLHRRWQGYRGDSSDSTDLLFSVKKSSLIQFRTELDVFLASNVQGDVCDFKIKGSWLERSCTIHAGNSPAIVAQMHKKYNIQSVVLGKDAHAVTVYPNVDFAFIAALIVILFEVNVDRND